MSKSKKAIDGTEYDVVDQAPVELDPPDPALTRWQELADRDRTLVHCGDAELVLPFPRPAWADPDEDSVTDTPLTTLYRGRPVKVAVSRHPGRNDGVVLTPAAAFVQPVIGGSGNATVRVSFCLRRNGKWDNDSYLAFVRAEAEELIDALRAAIDLIGGTE